MVCIAHSFMKAYDESLKEAPPRDETPSSLWVCLFFFGGGVGTTENGGVAVGFAKKPSPTRVPSMNAIPICS